MFKMILKLMLTFVFVTNVLSQSLPPDLSNFRIKNAQKSRVYFDSNVALKGSDTKGFIISDRKLSGLHINVGQKTGHYFTVSKSFTFWDNNMIRYSGGSNLKSQNGVPLNSFTLQYLKNNIEEPKGKGNIYYVSVKGNNNNNGLSESKPWRTISYAALVAKAGDVVYIKAGDYGKEKVKVRYSGTVNNPIKFIGYKSSPGDKPKLNRSQTTKFSPTEMPYIHTTDNSGDGISTGGNNFLVIKNIQVKGYFKTISFGESNFTILDNVYTKGGTRCIDGFNFDGTQNRVINSYAANASGNGIIMSGSRHLIDGNFVTSYGKNNMDYYIVMYGGSIGLGEHIIRNNTVIRDTNDTHPGHGVSIKASGRPIEYCLVENNKITNVGMAIEVRHSQVQHNVYRGNEVDWNGVNNDSYVGIQITSAQNNIIENNVFNTEYGVRFLGSIEDTKAKDAGNNNLFRNNIWYNKSGGFALFIYLYEDGGKLNRVPNNNTFVNNTIINPSSMFFYKANEYGKGNKFINCVIQEVKKEYFSGSNPHNFTYEYTNFYSKNKSDWSYKKKSGNGNTTLNPKFENSSEGNYRLKSDSPLIDKGKNQNEVKRDFEGNHRPQGKSIDIGAFEYKDNTTSAVEADAGEDQRICLGETVTLTASGGTTYSWSNGATTSSIEVSPTETTTYSVKVSDGISEATDKVVVSVDHVIADAGIDVTISQGSSVKLTASGGDHYKWSTGETTQSIEVNPENTTTYSVEVGIGSCWSTDEVKVAVKNGATSVILANAGEDQRICLGESVTLIATGGTTYSWSNGATTSSIEVSPTETTTYSVKVSDGNSEATDKVIVSVDHIIAEAGEDVTISQGSSIKLTASGGDGYKWSTGETTQSIIVTPDKTQIYSVLVSIGECQDTDEVSVEVNTTVSDLPGPDADAGEDQTICLGQSLLLTGQGGDDYKWSSGEESSTITVNPTRTTTYTVQVTKNGKKDSDTVTITVENCEQNNIETEELLSDNNIQVYPNPTKGNININISEYENDLDVHLINLTGSVLLHEKVQPHQKRISTQFDISNFTKGIYFVRFSNANESYVKKIILI